MSDLRKAVQDFLTHWDSPQWTDTAETVAAISVMRKALAETEQSEPYGRVTVVKRPGCADMHWFYRHPEPPYLDNAAECHTVYTAAPPRREPLTDEQAKLIAKVGPVYAPDGVITRRPLEYRAELEGARLAGIRMAEKHHGITGEKP